MDLAYINDSIVKVEEASVPVNCLAFTLGGSVFEAIRVFWNSQKKSYYVFNAKKHVRRLFDSLKVMRMHWKYTEEDILNIIEKIVTEWDQKENGYIRITAYIGEPAPGGSVYDPNLVETKLCVTIVSKENDITLKEGINCCVSSWTRISDNCTPPRVKSACNYENTRLAGHEAKLNGYDNAVLLNKEGKVSEAAESAIFYIDREGRLVTPVTTSDILESINREMILSIWKDLYGVDAIEKVVDRTELYLAKEMFICNTAKMIRPVLSLDKIAIGNGEIGEITRKISERYQEIVMGYDENYNNNCIIINLN